MRNLTIEILVEEPSMRNFLEVVLPKILPDGFILYQNCFIRDHEGKEHLKKELPKKVRAIQKYSKPIKLIVLHDQHSADCKVLKNELIKTIDDHANIPYLIRIICRELESWYLGDMDVIKKVYPNFKAERYRNWSKFRNPEICNAYNELKTLIPNFQKGYASREIPKYMNLKINRSKSFSNLIKGIDEFLN